MDEKIRIEKIMQAENMNSTQFALETGIQTSTLSHILNGRNKVSLDVLKKILNRFTNISSDWLILGVGSMTRQELHSQTPTLFDFDSEIFSKSDNSEQEIQKKQDLDSSSNNQNPPFSDERKLNNIFNPTPTIKISPRKIKRVIVYFDDNSFQEFSED